MGLWANLQLKSRSRGNYANTNIAHTKKKRKREAHKECLKLK